MADEATTTDTTSDTTNPGENQDTTTNAADGKVDDIDKLKKQNNSLLGDLGKSKSALREAQNKLAALEKEKNDAETARLEKKGEVEKLYQSEKAKTSKLQTNWITAELKAAAAKEGIMDLEFVKLINTDNVRVTDSGIEGVEETIKALKASKPNWFAAPESVATTTTTATQAGKASGANVSTPAAASGNPGAAGLKPGSPEAEKYLKEWEASFSK
ncbi:MAG TPA: hypothetical protein V6C76_11705 [Drouetiella sp.]